MSNSLNIFTVDLEEWFHINDSTWKPVEQWASMESRIEDNTTLILDFLDLHKIQATFFVLGWIAETYPELVKKIVESGHELGYHSYYHRIPRFQSRGTFESDLEKGITLIEKLTGKQVKYYRAPNFSLKNKWMLESLADHGIQVSSSIKNPMLHNGKELPEVPFIFTRNNRQLIELPLNTFRLFFYKFAFSGSGYFRILPQAVIQHLYKNKTYLLMYFHPRDFDSSLPTPHELGWKRNLLNTIGTSTTLTKLESLTARHPFISVGQALKQLDLNKLPIIEF